MDRKTAIELLNELALEEAALSEGLTKEGKERSDRFIKAIDAGIKALEHNRCLQNRCYALTHGGSAGFALMKIAKTGKRNICHRKKVDFVDMGEI